MAKKYVSWRRVSTFKQSKSGLGLEAQKEIIRYFVERDGGELIADFSECYTGKELSGCKELRKAMTYAKETGAILVIAKSDRFRNCQEALGILDEMGEGNLEFCDLPHSDRFTLTLFWALAEREALITSIRTKQALAAKKARGEKLGGGTDKWKESHDAKSMLELREEQNRRACSKVKTYLMKKDTRAFIKVLQRVFPTACDGNVEDWHEWYEINTKGDNKRNIIRAMMDMKELDPTGEVFSSWDFNGDDVKLQVRLATTINTLRKSVSRYRVYLT